MTVVAVIPTKGKSPYLNSLIKTLDQHVDDIFIYNNSDKPDIGLPPWVKTWHTPNLSIYEMWNKGLDKAEFEYYQPHVLVLNDDVEFGSYLPAVLSAYLLRDPELAITFPDYDTTEDTGSYSLKYTSTTAGAGGMSGFCFMIKSELRLMIDENLKLYWGDDDLVKQVIAKGYKIARIVGLPVKHAGSYTIKQMDVEERRAIMEADRVYFNQKYNENREPVMIYE